MTREEAISYFKRSIAIGDTDDERQHNKALDMAIKALEQESCEDAIIRHVVKEQMLKYGFNALDMTVTEFVENLPPVIPQSTYEDIAKAFQLGLVFGFGEKHDEMDKVIEDIKKGITPQPKSGHWIGIDEEPHEDYECDRCGYVVSTYTANIEPHTEYNYCPNCGAKMEEKNE